MAHQNAVLEPFVKNTAAAIIRRDSDAAWDSAVLKSAPPKPQPSTRYVHQLLLCSLRIKYIVVHHAQ